jgi:S1-C subfamily serine protease
MESRTKPDQSDLHTTRRHAGGRRTFFRGIEWIAGLLLVLICAGDLTIGQAIVVPAANSHGRVKTGTGFFISRYGSLVTSAHVVSGCDGVAVWVGGIEPREARIVAADLRRDIALLSTEGEVADIASVSDPPHVGDATFELGFGVIAKQPRTAMLSRGVFVGDGVTPIGDPVLVIQARVPEGGSGGPVLVADGSLIGMAIGYYTDRPDLGVVIPSADIDAFLGAHSLALVRGRAIAGAVKSPRDVLLRISALVQCVPWHTRQMAPEHGLTLLLLR